MRLRRYFNACSVRDHRLRFSLARGLRQRARVQTTKARSASGASGGIPLPPDPYRPLGSLERRPRRISASATVSSPGRSITSTVTITAIDGFSSPVNLSRRILSPTAELDRSLPPMAVAPDSSTNGIATTLTVRRRGNSGKPGNSIAFLHSGLMVLRLAFMEAPPAILGRTGISILLPRAVLVAGIGCGGGGGDAAPDNYSVTATATAGTVIHGVSISVIV